MKKMLIAAIAAMIAATSCKKTDDGGNNPGTSGPTLATLTKVPGDSVFASGTNILCAKFSFVVLDTTAVQAVNVFSSNTNISIRNVKVVFTTSMSSFKAHCSDMGTVPEGRQFMESPFNKSMIPATYAVELYVDVITSTIDSTNFLIKLDCRTQNKIYKLQVKNPKTFFITGNVNTKISANTPVSKNVVAGTGIIMTSISTSVAGIDQTMTSMDVVVNNPLVSAVKVMSGGAVLGTTSVSGTNTYTVSFSKFLAKGTTTDFDIVYDFGSFTTTTQTGLATSAVVTKITYADNAQNELSTYSGNTMYVYKSLISFSGPAVNQSVATFGNDLYSLTATTTGSGAIKQISFSVLWGKAPISTDTLGAIIRFFEGSVDITSHVYITNQNGDTIQGNKITTATNVITVTWIGGESTVSNTKTYKIRGVCTGFKTAGSYMQIDFVQDINRIVGRLSYNGNYKVSVAGVAVHTAWTDRSHPAHTSVVGPGATPDYISSAGMQNAAAPTTTTF